MDILRDLYGFMTHRKKYWMLPIILTLLAIGLLVVLGGTSAVAPFIYALF